MTHILAPLLAVLFLLPLTSQAALSVPARAILDDAKRLGVETDAEAGLQALKSRPKADVVKALREGLKAGEPWVGTSAQAAAALGYLELLPDLKKVAASADSWKVFVALRSLAGDADKKSVEALYLSVLEKVSVPSQVAILDALGSWKMVLPDETFSKLTKHSQNSVKRAAVQQFLVARESYSTAQQTERFKTAFALKPYQLRLDTMRTFLDLSKEERVSLSKSVTQLNCGKEKNAEVKPVCQQVISSVRGEKS